MSRTRTFRNLPSTELPQSDRLERGCAYLRVSTGRQAESDLSIPDQRKQIARFCEAKGWHLVAEYVEPGASATDEHRPEFQKLIDRACEPDHPFDTIVVHSYSRFFRDAFHLEVYIRKLAKAGVRLVSITQELSDNPVDVMMRQIIAMFDEYQSKENGKHVLRAMRENATQGFYNGSVVPLGYKTEEVEKRGVRIKKKLVIDNVEQETVKLIFKLYLHGDGETGPIGVKQIVTWLNSRGHRTRRGKRFGVGTLHGILTNTVYIGEWRFNRINAKTGQEKPLSEHIIVQVPAIIERSEFDKVQKELAARNPRVLPPRVVTGPILLTGLAVCATCGGAMTLRSGTSRGGKIYRYYTCSSAARVGDTACKGRSVPMDALDTLVVDHLSERLFTAERLTEMLSYVLGRQAANDAEVNGRIINLQREVSEAESKVNRLYALVEQGLVETDKALGDRIKALREDRERAQAALERIRGQSALAARVSPEAIELFAVSMRHNIRNGNMNFRRAYLRSIIDRIEVDDEKVKIYGDSSTLEQAVAGERRVRAFEQRWRALRDSNS